MIQTTSASDTTLANIGYAYATDSEGLGLVVREGNAPRPQAGEVLVRIEAASINYRDLLVAKGKPAELIPLSDGAGVIEEVGEGVTRWRAGNRVAAGFFRDWIDGPFVATYHASARGGGGVEGMLTRYMVAHESQLASVPDSITIEQAATLPCAGTTAWSALFVRAKLKAGDTVLVLGTGGVSIFGLQLATAAGAKVIVTSSSDEKLDRARSLGAWETINYNTHPEWDEEVLRLTDGLGVTHILDTAGKGTFERSLKAVCAGGSIAQIGGLAGFGPELNLMRLQLINADIHGINVGSVANLQALIDYLAEHKISPIVDHVYDFEQAPQAYEDIAAGRLFGKLVIRI
jgi:NADPH:quinone reductase-like Zn-dependent oxidoreductase